VLYGLLKKVLNERAAPAALDQIRSRKKRSLNL
jgi:hypothetical protein